MRLSDNGRKLIQGFEGLSLKAYPDAAGYSIGYGHFGAKPGDVIDHAEADRLFNLDVAKFEDGVSLLVSAPSQQEFDAMVSLAYNIGLGDLSRKKDGGFATSSVQRLHNIGDKQGAADAFRLWNKSQGAVLPVLVKRRDRERLVYLQGYGVSPYTQPAQSIAWSVPSAEPGAAPASTPASTPAVAVGVGAVGVAALGLGLVFFCPCCGARLAAEISAEPAR